METVYWMGMHDMHCAMDSYQSFNEIKTNDLSVRRIISIIIRTYNILGHVTSRLKQFELFFRIRWIIDWHYVKPVCFGPGVFPLEFELVCSERIKRKELTASAT
jgi:hypothetical protein